MDKSQPGFQYLLTSILLIFTIICFGQEKYKVLKFFSGYNHISDENFTTTSQSSFNEGSFDFLRSVSLALVKDRWFHEVEIDRIQTIRTRDENTRNGVTVSGAITNNTFLQARYSYNYTLIHQNRIRITTGLSLSPFYTKERIKPLVLSSFERSTKWFGAYLELMPRIQYDLNHKLILEINAPLPIANWFIEKRWIDNPAIPEDQQNDSKTFSEFLPQFSQASIGIGIKL